MIFSLKTFSILLGSFHSKKASADDPIASLDFLRTKSLKRGLLNDWLLFLRTHNFSAAVKNAKSGVIFSKEVNCVEE